MKMKAFIWLATIVCAGSASAQGLPLRPSHGLVHPSNVTAGPNSAKTHSNATALATTSSEGGTGVGVGSQGQSLSMDSHAVYHAQARNPVATAVAPPLTSSNDTCMGSTSFGGSAVSFGFSAGTTWTDKNCVMLKNAREMWNMGFKGAALARLCMDELNKEALEVTGINCPVRANGRQAESSQASGGDSINNTDDGYRN